jgi:hypothetical protein
VLAARSAQWREGGVQHEAERRCVHMVPRTVESIAISYRLRSDVITALLIHQAALQRRQTAATSQLTLTH